MKILMVCLGNICRSPLAEGIMKHKCEERGLDWTIDSAGTSGWHKGELPDSRSISTAQEHGIDITDQRSRQFLESDFSNFDLILAMDSSNYQDIIKKTRDKAAIDKVKLILNYVFPGENRQVPDPYYNNGFDHVYGLLDSACERILDEFAGHS